MLASWKGKWLSLAGRITLIKASMMAVPIYTMYVFQIPNKVAKIIEVIRRFLWCRCDEKFKYNLVRWDEVCSTVKQSGLGIRKCKDMNHALGIRLVWRIYNEKDKLWSKVLQAKYMLNNVENLFTCELSRGSSMWNFLKSYCSILSPDMCWKWSRGDKINFLRDQWIIYNAFSENHNYIPLMTHLEVVDGPLVKDYVVGCPPNKSRKRLTSPILEFRPVCEEIQEFLDKWPPIGYVEEDRRVWIGHGNGTVTVKEAFNKYSVKGGANGFSLFRNKMGIPKMNAFLWIAWKKKALTWDRLQTMGKAGQSICVIRDETNEHLFLHCDFAWQLRCRF
ncbi:hypothetical protein SUGI_0956030 [Cryptomeria japonica]|nr:hypothetical protein SUGI_0956030 [Cryptomeria japonica]